jgi:predicted permease
MDVGFEPDRVFLASFDLQPLGYDRPRSEAFYDEVLRRARTLPTVEHAALADFVALAARGASVSLTIAGREAPEGERRFTIPYNRVTEGYFATVRQPLIRGRDFTIGDTRGAPLVAIVTEAMAHRYWPGEDAIGKRVRIEGEPAEREVVAIARDARFASFGDDIGPFIFLPVRQVYGPQATLHVRVTTDSSSALADIRRLVRDIDQNVALSDGQTMRGAMAFRLIPVRVAHTVFSIGGLIGLLLGAGGLYGLVCYTLERRLKEIGIRVALGASRRQVLRLITGGAVRLTVIGILVGVAIAAGAMRLFSALLYGIGAVDPLTFGVIGTLLLAVTAAAGYAAARKGLDVDPVVVLRE